MPFEYCRTLRFHETDGAGVIYFANGLVLCHEAYEASLAAGGIDLKGFFAPGPVAYPIVHATLDFRRPLFCGDRIVISLVAQATGETAFTIDYRLRSEAVPDTLLATAQTCHVCIDPAQRARLPLPPPMLQWLEQVGSSAG